MSLQADSIKKSLAIVKFEAESQGGKAKILTIQPCAYNWDLYKNRKQYKSIEDYFVEIKTDASNIKIKILGKSLQNQWIKDWCRF